MSFVGTLNVLAVGFFQEMPFPWGMRPDALVAAPSTRSCSRLSCLLARQRAVLWTAVGTAGQESSREDSLQGAMSGSVLQPRNRLVLSVVSGGFVSLTITLSPENPS